MENKKCFKCNVEKPLALFYKHKQMGDGHLNKCIDCAKKDVQERSNLLKTNKDWIEKERARGREKYERLNYKGKNKPTRENKAKFISSYFHKFPEKEYAHIKSQRISTLIKGNQNHHWSYNKEHVMDVIELTVKEHNKLHRYTIYDQERMMYRKVNNGELIDSREKCLSFISEIKDLI